MCGLVKHPHYKLSIVQLRVPLLCIRKSMQAFYYALFHLMLLFLHQAAIRKRTTHMCWRTLVDNTQPWNEKDILPHRILFSQLAPVAQKPSLSGTGLQHFTQYNATPFFVKNFQLETLLRSTRKLNRMITHRLPLPALMRSAVKKMILLQNKWQMQGESESPKSQEEVLNSAQ